MSLYTDMINGLLMRLFNGDELHLKQWQDRLIDEHKDLTSNPAANVVLYAGTFFRHSTAPSRTSGPRPSVSWDLNPKFDQLVRAKKQFEEDKSFIRQTLHLLLESCITDEETRNALPECLIPFAPSHYRDYPRTKEAGYTLQDKPGMHRQYETMLPLIHSYAASSRYL